MASIDSVTVDATMINVPEVQDAMGLIKRMAMADPAEVSIMGTGQQEAYRLASDIAARLVMNDQRRALAGLPKLFTLPQAALALHYPASAGWRETLASRLLHLGFTPEDQRQLYRERQWQATGPEAIAARNEHPTPVGTAVLSRARISELLDYASVYEEFDETTPIGTPSSHGTVLSEGQLGAIIAYKKVLCLLPEDWVPPVAAACGPTEAQDRQDRMADCPCECHANTCGAADMAMAERTIRLVAGLRPYSADMVNALDELVLRAGPEKARAAIGELLDEEVPF